MGRVFIFFFLGGCFLWVVDLCDSCVLQQYLWWVGTYLPAVKSPPEDQMKMLRKHEMEVRGSSVSVCVI